MINKTDGVSEREARCPPFPLSPILRFRVYSRPQWYDYGLMQPQPLCFSPAVLLWSIFIPRESSILGYA